MAPVKLQTKGVINMSRDINTLIAKIETINGIGAQGGG
nr:MAG TPA: hypothetical protein [Caudoviricetes sp.]